MILILPSSEILTSFLKVTIIKRQVESFRSIEIYEYDEVALLFVYFGENLGLMNWFAFCLITRVKFVFYCYFPKFNFHEVTVPVKLYNLLLETCVCKCACR